MTSTVYWVAFKMEARTKITEHRVTNVRDITRGCLGPAPRDHCVYSTALSNREEEERTNKKAKE